MLRKPSSGASSGQTTPTTKDGKPTKPDWPSAVKYRPPTLGKRGEKAPAVKVTAKPGVYVWEDFDGWHMWVVGGAGVPPKVTGLITSNAEFNRADLAVPGTGTVTKGGISKPFVAVLDVEPDSAVIGAVFEATITERSTETLALQFVPADPIEADTPFDGVDFFTLAETAGRIEILPGSTPHNLIRRAIQTHDHYAVVAQ